MATIVENDKGFKVIKMDYFESIIMCEFGDICDSCNRIIGSDESFYYVAVLDRIFCTECYKEWYETAIKYKEDDAYENRKFNAVIRKLQIASGEM